MTELKMPGIMFFLFITAGFGGMIWFGNIYRINAEATGWQVIFNNVILWAVMMLAPFAYWLGVRLSTKKKAKAERVTLKQ